MAKYIENPKTKGSGIYCCIPQRGVCPIGCADCFFQSGRSYLEPLSENLPNMPEPNPRRIVRVNDGNDSNNFPGTVMEATEQYPFKFYNTSIPSRLDRFDAPVVLTANPGIYTDTNAALLAEIPSNLMFVRVRTNAWNLEIVDSAVKHYSAMEVPIVLTFMAYFTQDIPEEHRGKYVFRKRTLNSYHAITTAAWEEIMARYKYNQWVYSCGKIEGEKGTTKCARCGNCVREYFVTLERMTNQRPSHCAVTNSNMLPTLMPGRKGENENRTRSGYIRGTAERWLPGV
jgi:hypothetical protein